jgi:ABC-type glutathione transport system ATPase component
VLADYQLFHVEADRRWINHAEARLATLAEEVRHDAVLVGHELHKSFGLTEALRGRRLTLHKGRIAAVMGPSGSGKCALPTAGCRRLDLCVQRYDRQVCVSLPGWQSLTVQVAV